MSGRPSLWIQTSCANPKLRASDTAKAAAQIAARMAAYMGVPPTGALGNRMKPQTPLERKLTKARTQLLLNQPFFGSLCLRLKLVPGDVLTMATNGKLILYNCGFVESLTPRQSLRACWRTRSCTALLHTIARRGSRDLQLSNEAADFAINPIVLNNGLTLPDGALNDSQYVGLSAEEIYARLLQNERNASGGQCPSPPQAGPGGSGPNSAAASPSQTGCAIPDQQSRGTQPTSGGHDCPSSVPDSRNKDTDPTLPRPGGFGEILDASDDSGDPAPEAEIARQQHECGASPPSRPSGPPKHVDMSLPSWTGHSRRAVSRSRIGGPSCATLLPQRRLLITDGHLRTVALLHPGCTCPRSIAKVSEKSSSA